MTTTINAKSTGIGGLDVTCDASGSLELQTGGVAALTIDTSQRTAFVAGTAAAPAITRTGDTNTGMFFPAADTIAFAEGGAESMRIDSSGNVGIGTSAPNTFPGKLSVIGDGIVTDYDMISRVSSALSNADRGFKQITDGSGEFSIYSPNGGGCVFGIGSSYTERMRIDSSGNLLVGATSQFAGFVANAKQYVESSTSDYAVSFRSTATTAYGLAISYSTAPNLAGQNFIDARDSSAQRFAVVSNGGIRNYSANNANLSDERVKTDITPAKSYLNTICSIPVVTFKYNDQTDEELNLGVIAQAVDAVAPELVDHSGFGEAPEGESPYLAIYQTDLQYALMKCIQEQQTIINDLKARIETLEAR